MSQIDPKDMYEKVDPPSPMRGCPCCGSAGELWKYLGDPDSLVYIPGCSTVEGLGEDETMACPMYELDALRRATKREAVNAWNALVKQLVFLRTPTGLA